MLRKLFSGLALVGLAAVAQPAGAVTLDFVALASGNEHSFLTEPFANIGGSGITATVTARDLTDSTPPFDTTGPWGYLDDVFSGGDGGLGVCQTSNCAGSSDDNISAGEVAMVEFDTTVEITSISFSNGVHVDVYNGSIGIHVGATNPTTAETFNNIFAAAAVINTSLIGSRFSFVADESFVQGGSGDLSRIYVSSITFDRFPNVPEPASTWLLGTGLAGLAVFGRRRQL